MEEKKGADRGTKAKGGANRGISPTSKGPASQVRVFLGLGVLSWAAAGSGRYPIAAFRINADESPV